MSTNGKGSRPRPVDKSKWDQNYESIFGRKTWMDWAKEYGNIIYDPDGFDRSNPNKKYTRAEYEAGLAHCTILLVGKLPWMQHD